MPSTLHSLALISLGLIPSLAWLLIYVRKDCHPEPKNLLAQTFLMGIILSPGAILLQLGFIHIVSTLFGFNVFTVQGGPYFLAWAALAEEFIKFYAVRLLILRNPNFDEPVDAIVYMIVAGLGFAAMENILVMFRVYPDGASATLGTWALRFTGATLLHALASGLMGYFLAMAWFFRSHHKKLIFIGLIIATIFHFTFNSFLTANDNRLGLTYSTSLLLIMAYLLSILFDKVRDRNIRSAVQLTSVDSRKVINLIG